jgi:tetratricopeptide (TPR) repeat protein
MTILFMINNHFERLKVVISFFGAIFLVTSCMPRFIQIRRAELLYKEGQALLSEGKEEEAMLKFEKSLSLARNAGFKAGVAHNFNEMAIIHTSRGAYGKARALLTKAVDIYKEAHMQPEVSKSLNNIALTYVRERDFKKAIDQYEELLTWDRKTDNLLGEGITLYNMGLIYAHYLGEREEARRRYAEALKIFKKLGNKKYIRAVEKHMGIE